MPRELLPEVSEADARGSIAEVYEDIRRVLGLPLVNLVYRHLAVVPGRLEAVWAELRPNLADEAIDAMAEELLALAALGIPRISRAVLSAAGVFEPQLDRVFATLDAYNHANPRNLIAIEGLIGAAPAGDHGRGLTSGSDPGIRSRGDPVTVERQGGGEILPIAGLGGLDPSVIALLREMAEPFSGRSDATLVPGLFRHFAGNPALLAVLWTALRPSVEGRALARLGNRVAHRARVLAAGLPHAVQPVAEPETRNVLVRFASAVSQMLVAGTALARALR